VPVKLGRLTSWILVLLVRSQERCPATSSQLSILICLLERNNLELIENHNLMEQLEDGEVVLRGVKGSLDFLAQCPK